MGVSKRKIYNIAKKHIYGLPERGDLKAHNSDREDFLDIAVWSLEDVNRRLRARQKGWAK
jgi:hypothetical protein